MPSKLEQVIRQDNTIIVVVRHQGITSWSRSVMPCARKAWRALPYEERNATRCEVGELGYHWDREADVCHSAYAYGPTHEGAKAVLHAWLRTQELDPQTRRKLDNPEPAQV